jgi:hypothetical protein
MLASAIVDEVASQLNDNDHITWLEDKLLDYITTAEEAIILLRPDAYSNITTMLMASGAKQSLPSTALRLLDIKRNMGSDGATPGRVVHPCSADSIDLFAFDWNADTEEEVVKNFSYDERTPTFFFVDPPSDGVGHIEISVSRVPPEVTSVGQTLVLKDIYRNAIIQWCMFRAYSIEVDSASSQRRALAHETSFYGLMGKKIQRDVTFSPSPEVTADVN